MMSVWDFFVLLQSENQGLSMHTQYMFGTCPVYVRCQTEQVASI